MSKSDRLFRLLHLFRTLPKPVTAERLALDLDVSLRTLYRDIAALRISGARIEGEAGFGYSFTEDPALPPQMFERLEVEALLLGLAEVQASGDKALSDAAESALAKIIATLPERVQRQAMNAVLQIHRYNRPAPPPHWLALLREACWDEKALDMHYADVKGTLTQRRIWPLSIVFMENTQMLLAFCCLRQDLRSFRLERIQSLVTTQESFRPRRVPLLRQFLERLNEERKAASPCHFVQECAMGSNQTAV